jgi:hypothetical protein
MAIIFLLKREGNLRVILKPDEVDNITRYSEVDRFLQPYGAN